MSEPIDMEEDDHDGTKGKKSDFIKVGSGLLGNIPVKMSLFMFFLGMIIFSDLFINGVLVQLNKSFVEGECTTTPGTIVQLTVFILGYIILELLNKGEWI